MGANRRLFVVRPASIEKQKNTNSCEEDISMDVCVLRSYFWFLSIFGIFNPVSLGKEQCDRLKKRHRIFRGIGQFTVFLSFLNFCRHFLTYRNTKDFEEAIPKILISLFFVQCLVNSAVLYRLCHKEEYLHFFVKIWKNKTQLTTTKLTSLRKKTIAAIVIISFIVVANTVFFGYVLFQVDFFDNVIAPYTVSDSIGDFLKCVYIFYKIFLTGAWISLCSLEVIIIIVIVDELAIFNDNLKKSTLENNFDIETFRQRFTFICQLIRKANDMFNFYNGVKMMTAVAHVLLLLYSLIWFPATREEGLVFLAHIFWIIAVSGILTSITISCIILNHLVCVDL